MDLLTALGVVSTGAAILFYHLEPRHSGWVLAFAAASLSSSIYAFLQGAWPFGVAELFWVGVASHRYWFLIRGGAIGYVAPADPLTLAGTQLPATPLPATQLRPSLHCHAGYPLRLIEVTPPARREYRSAAIG